MFSLPIVSHCLTLLMAFTPFHPKDGIDGFKYASRHGAPFKIHLYLVTPDGQPVPNAKVHFRYCTGLSAFGALLGDRWSTVQYRTGQDGAVVLSGNTVGLCRLHINKEGYYSHTERFAFWELPPEKRIQDGRWQPYGEHKTIVFKPIIRPISMYVYHPLQHTFQNRQFPVGLRFEKGDFIIACKESDNADVLLDVQVVQNAPENIHLEDGECCIKWRLFFSRPKDGVCVRPANASDLRSDHCADPAWAFTPEFVSFMVYSPQGKFLLEKSRPMSRVDIEQQYYLLRVRTRVDSNGKIIASNYAKIYLLGDKINRGIGTHFSKGEPVSHYINLAYFFNPIPNDVSLEPDRRHPLGKWKDNCHLSDYWH